MENTEVNFEIDPIDMGFTPEEQSMEAETEEKVEQEVKPEAEPTSEVKEEPIEQPKENPYKFKVKVNHLEEEKEFTKEDIVKALQKESDYDNKYTKAKELETEISELRKELEFFGIKDKDSLRQYRLDTEVKQLVDEGVPEDKARELVELKNAETLSKMRAKEIAQKEADDKEIADFLTENNIKADEVPAEVIEKWKNGEKLKYAYKDYQLEQTKKELHTLKQNLSNEKKAVVTATTEHGTTETEKLDPFEQGFFGK